MIQNIKMNKEQRGSQGKGYIPLGPARNKAKLNKENSLPFIPSPLSKPIIIRYIDPKLVPLFIELGKLSQKVQSFALRAEIRAGEENQKEREQLQGLISSSKQLSAKMSEIMEEDELGNSSGLNPPEKVMSEYQYVEGSKPGDRMEQTTQSMDSIDMVEVLNRVSEKIEELETENSQLHTDLAALAQQNERLILQKQEMSSSLLKLKREKEVLALESEKKEKNLEIVVERMKADLAELASTRRPFGENIDQRLSCSSHSSFIKQANQ